MNKELIKRELSILASQLRDQGVEPALGGRAGWAMTCWQHVQRHRPDITRHMHGHYSTDPYQVFKGWMPSWTEDSNSRG